MNNDVESSFSFSQISSRDVFLTLKNLKNKSSSGFDGLNTIFLKRINSNIAYPLSIIINQSLNTGIIPDQLKTAKIIPLFKKNDDSIFDNYRPIALLPTFSKILEKVVYNQIYKYLDDNNLISPSQHGFRKNHSTETAVIELKHYLKSNMNKKHVPIGLFLDLSKAFETINFVILLYKLSHLGINGIAISWFENYLKNRKQFVSFNDVNSDFLTPKTGVPKGSVLGPLLFLIYISMI